MANTYTLISSNVLTGSAASVTFSSIPSTYTDLVLRTSSRSSTGNSEYTIRFNGDTGTNYSYTYLLGNGSSASSSRATSDVYGYGWTNLSTWTANTFASGEIYIPSYTASQNKPFYVIDMQENNSTTAVSGPFAELWRSTAAITSITLAPPTSFVSGSSFYLYGIKNS